MEIEDYKLGKRELGNGRWDKLLKRNMTELSLSDNYDDAKHEWRATGEVWWQGIGTPRPDWAAKHPRTCLCGHRIVYHFEIENTETGVRECVGSDHINSYMILRAISEETGIDSDAITESMIQEWIDVRVSALKKDAWWNANGEDFIATFNEIKELDLRINVRRTGRYMWDNKLGIRTEQTKIRKVSRGEVYTSDYEMASIVWRWNHPDNTRNQQNGRGYPNDRLMQDLSIFHALIAQHRQEVKEEDDAIEAAQQRKMEYEQQLELRNKVWTEKTERDFRESCEYFGIPHFTTKLASNDWETKFLTDMVNRVSQRKDISPKQISTLMKIINRYNDNPTIPQIKYLRALGYEGDIDSLSKGEVSKLIDELKEEK